jgi:hypothetical protein
MALFGLMLIGGLWIAHKIESRFVLHGVLAGIVANVLFVIYLFPWILRDQLPGEYWIEVFESFAIRLREALWAAISAEGSGKNLLHDCQRFRTLGFRQQRAICRKLAFHKDSSPAFSKTLLPGFSVPWISHLDLLPKKTETEIY